MKEKSINTQSIGIDVNAYPRIIYTNVNIYMSRVPVQHIITRIANA